MRILKFVDQVLFLHECLRELLEKHNQVKMDKAFCEEEQTVCSQMQTNAMIPFTIDGARAQTAGEDKTLQKRWFGRFIQ
jgi:hypothetical protein